jgi:hypothetical protein
VIQPSFYFVDFNTSCHHIFKPKYIWYISLHKEAREFAYKAMELEQRRIRRKGG